MGQQQEIGHGGDHSELMPPKQHDQTPPRRLGSISPSVRTCRGRLAFLTGAVLLSGTFSVSVLANAAVLDGHADQKAMIAGDRPDVQLVQTQQNERAREQAIIGRLEEELRRLNGRIEELEYQQDQTNRRLDELTDRLDQGAEASGNADLGAREPVIVDQTARSPEEALQELVQEPREGSLGSIPKSAVEGLPRPDPADIAAPDKGTFSAEQQYENAVQLLKAGDYQGAQNGLELFLDVHENHQLASNAAYWLAETHYVRQNYAAAAAAFARNYRNYGKDSPKAIDNLLKLGMSLSNLGESDKACLSYDELTNTFPNTPAHIQQAVNRERARAKCG